MKSEGTLSALIQYVLALGCGEDVAVRISSVPHGTFHRYRDGWHFLLHADDHHGCARALLGWSFREEIDVANFLLGALGDRLRNFGLVGECL